MSLRLTYVTGNSLATPLCFRKSGLAPEMPIAALYINTVENFFLPSPTKSVPSQDLLGYCLILIFDNTAMLEILCPPLSLAGVRGGVRFKEEP